MAPSHSLTPGLHSYFSFLCFSVIKIYFLPLLIPGICVESTQLWENELDTFPFM